MNHEKSIQDVYAQRNELVLALAKTLPGSGWGVDKQKEGWDDEWKTVIYLNTPGGQLSFHVGPTVGNRAREELPRYEGEWDGTWWVDHGHRLKSLVCEAPKPETAKGDFLKAVATMIPDTARAVHASLVFETSGVAKREVFDSVAPHALAIACDTEYLTAYDVDGSKSLEPLGDFRFQVQTRTF